MKRPAGKRQAPPAIPPERVSGATRATFWRSLQTMSATRVVIAGVLLLYVFVQGSGLRGGNSLMRADICILYLVLALGFWMMCGYRRRRFQVQLMAQIATDIVIISMLYESADGMRSGLAILYLFPLAGAAILARLTLALFSASLATLFLIGETLYRMLVQDGERQLLQAGLYGAAFFALVLVLSRLAAKLISQEELAQQHGKALAIQQAINRLVMADMGDGIIVVGSDGRNEDAAPGLRQAGDTLGGRVFTGNPAAQRMLGLFGLDQEMRLTGTPALAPIADAYAAWLLAPANNAVFVNLKTISQEFPDSELPSLTSSGPNSVTWSGQRQLQVHLKVRFARVDTGGLVAERSVIFLQDVTAIENQAQELKLASMGRLTASIAHEVRNPLSAIGHATALLGDDLHEPVHRRLLKIVGDNVARVNRMVEDILQLSRKVQPHNAPLALGPMLTELCAEFQAVHGLADGIVILSDPGPATVRFDPLHLREVVLNLLTNAVRYASGGPASMHLFVLTERAGHMELHVQDDGQAITPEVRAHLFEPFYTTSSKGTGLGLYLARELCLNNGALLDYEYRFGGHAAVGDAAPPRLLASGRFVITFARAG